MINVAPSLQCCCDQQEMRACCLPDDQCIVATQIACQAQGGVYLPDVMTCAPNPCLVGGNGRCCLRYNCNDFQTIEQCSDSGGWLWEPGSCSQAPGLCCPCPTTLLLQWETLVDCSCMGPGGQQGVRTYAGSAIMLRNFPTCDWFGSGTFDSGPPTECQPHESELGLPFNASLTNASGGITDCGGTCTFVEEIQSPSQVVRWVNVMVSPMPTVCQIVTPPACPQGEYRSYTNDTPSFPCCGSSMASVS